MHMNGQISIHLDLFYLNTFALQKFSLILRVGFARPRTKKFLMQLEYRWNEGRLYSTFLVPPFIKLETFFFKAGAKLILTVRNNSSNVGFIAHTSDKTFRDSLTKAKFWLAVCSNPELETTVLKGLTFWSLREGQQLEFHLQQVGDHQAPAEGGCVWLILQVRQHPQ